MQQSQRAEHNHALEYAIHHANALGQGVIVAFGFMDDYWNACMLEMKHTGFMHNYMRMYWGKKILEWSSTPQKSISNDPGH